MDTVLLSANGISEHGAGSIHAKYLFQSHQQYHFRVHGRSRYRRAAPLAPLSIIQYGLYRYPAAHCERNVADYELHKDNVAIQALVGTGLKDVLGDVEELYGKKSRVEVRYNFAAAGIPRERIEEGLPADLFFTPVRGTGIDAPLGSCGRAKQAGNHL